MLLDGDALNVSFLEMDLETQKKVGYQQIWCMMGTLTTTTNAFSCFCFCFLWTSTVSPRLDLPYGQDLNFQTHVGALRICTPTEGEPRTFTRLETRRRARG